MEAARHDENPRLETGLKRDSAGTSIKKGSRERSKIKLFWWVRCNRAEPNSIGIEKCGGCGLNLLSVLDTHTANRCLAITGLLTQRTRGWICPGRRNNLERGTGAGSLAHEWGNTRRRELPWSKYPGQTQRNDMGQNDCANARSVRVKVSIGSEGRENHLYRNRRPSARSGGDLIEKIMQNCSVKSYVSNAFQHNDITYHASPFFGFKCLNRAAKKALSPSSAAERVHMAGDSIKTLAIVSPNNRNDFHSTKKYKQMCIHDLHRSNRPSTCSFILGG